MNSVVFPLWIAGVIRSIKASDESYLFSVFLLTRVCKKKKVSPIKVEVYAIACVIIASKFIEDTNYIIPVDFSPTYSSTFITDMELFVLGLLKWKISKLYKLFTKRLELTII